MNFEQAKELAEKEASEFGKIIVKIEENTEYWRFEAAFEDGHVDLDDGAGGCYVSKKDGSVRGLQPWDMEFTEKFYKTAKTIYKK